MSRLSDIQALIATDAEACAFKTKKSKFLGGFFTPQRKYLPQCEIEARQKYAAELEAAQNEAYSWDADVKSIFTSEAVEGLDPDVIKIIIIALIAVLAIAFVLA